MTLSTDHERLIVRFFITALGQTRQQTRAFIARIPEATLPRVLALAQTWNIQCRMSAHTEFVKLMGWSPFVQPSQQPLKRTHTPSPEIIVKVVDVPTPAGQPPVARSRGWTPERRAALSRKMKARWVAAHPEPQQRMATR
jgi:hypothetical protein